MRHLAHATHTGQFVEQTGHATHALHLLQLIAEVLQIEALALFELGDQLIRFALVELTFGFFYQRENVAHPQDTGGNTLRVERLQRFDLLAHTEELDRFTGDMTHRQRRTATGITISFGQDDTGQRQRIVKGLGSIGCILTGHGIDHKQRLDRIDRGMQLFDLCHHRFINMKTTSGVDNNHIFMLQARILNRIAGNINRLLISRGWEEGGTHFTSKCFQLLDGGRTVDVGRGDQYRFLLALAQPLGQLGDGGGFTGTLQTSHQNYRWRLSRQIQLIVGTAHDLNKFTVDDLHKDLAGAETLHNLLTNSTLAHPLNKLFNYRQRNVRLEQCHTHFPEGIFYIVFSQLRLASDML